MKLIMAIVNNDDSHSVSTSLTKAGFSVTKLSTTGGFLMAGNTTFLIGVDDDKTNDVISVIEKYSSKRKQLVPTTTAYGPGMYSSTMPVEVSVGGATVFVLNVERFEKL